MANTSGLAQLLMQQNEEMALRPRKFLGAGSKGIGAFNSPVKGLEGLIPNLVGIYMKNPKMFHGLFGLGEPSAISPAAAMTAYGNMPASYTMPGM